ncbi:hypothetical protein GRJ2_002610800 [Grus japonensis]|uniref:Uncharacterized protein n=1 Tax=Grus japonensis TaxID=30415 RepID=A0ABC9XVM4_GRUJA
MYVSRSSSSSCPIPTAGMLTDLEEPCVHQFTLLCNIMDRRHNCFCCDSKTNCREKAFGRRAASQTAGSLAALDGVQGKLFASPPSCELTVAGD